MHHAVEAQPISDIGARHRKARLGYGVRHFVWKRLILCVTSALPRERESDLQDRLCTSAGNSSAQGWE
jgi:hypothetical protein